MRVNFGHVCELAEIWRGRELLEEAINLRTHGTTVRRSGSAKSRELTSQKMPYGRRTWRAQPIIDAGDHFDKLKCGCCVDRLRR